MSKQSIDEQIEQLLDSHAGYYIKETMQFFKNNGISPALSKNNEGDLTAKTAIKALISDAEKQARINELREIPYHPNFIANYIEDRIKELEQS